MIPHSDQWKTGLSVEEFGLRIAKSLPRVAKIAEAGACCSEKMFQVLSKKSIAIAALTLPQPEILSADGSYAMCAACAEKCVSPESVTRHNFYDFRSCACSALSPGATCLQPGVLQLRPSLTLPQMAAS